MTETATRQPNVQTAPDRRRRPGAIVLLVVYGWIAAIFPVLHASSEQPVQASVVSGEIPPSSPLPAGHDHLTCHFCAATGTLVSPPSVVAVELPSYTVLPILAQPVAIVSQVLAWTHHAIPPRAPPLA